MGWLSGTEGLVTPVCPAGISCFCFANPSREGEAWCWLLYLIHTWYFKTH